MKFLRSNQLVATSTRGEANRQCSTWLSPIKTKHRLDYTITCQADAAVESSGWTACTGSTIGMCASHCCNMDRDRSRRMTKTRRSLSYPNQEKTLGMRRIGEPLRGLATLARLGQKHQFVHLCQQLERLQDHANLARSLEEAREMQWPCSRDSPTRTTKQASAAVSLQGFLLDLGKHSTPSRGIDCGQRSQMPQS